CGAGALGCVLLLRCGAVFYDYQILRLSIIMAPTSASSLFIPALAPVLYQDLVRQTLQEDLGRAGDLTSDAVIPDGVQATATLRAREAGVLAGLPIAVEAFTQLDARLQVQALLSDGQALQAG